MYARVFKWLLDILISAIALVILSPLFLILYIAVAVNMGRPVFFRQKRICRGEREFTLIKFRTMTDSRDKLGNLRSDEERLTGFGSLLRSTSLDELPELWNILTGKMSLVGPRPLLPEYLPYYTEQERLRHTVRPGLTGLAQINGRNALTWEIKFGYDIAYVKKITFMGDLKIFFGTFAKVFARSDIGADGAPTPIRLDIERQTAQETKKEIRNG